MVGFLLGTFFLMGLFGHIDWRKMVGFVETGGMNKPW